MSSADTYFRLGDWLVKPGEKAFECGDIRNVVEPKAMGVLMYLADRPGVVVTSEELLNACWAGTFYGDNPVHKVIAQLRKALHDQAVNPSYIKTIRKRGYRLIAPVSFPGDAGANRTAVTWSGGSPYLGLEAFDSHHSDIFFGRGEALSELFTRIQQRVQNQLPFILILGPSGSGKTSLVRAGILPQLMSAHGVHAIQAIASVTAPMGAQRADDPVQALVDALLQWRMDEQVLFAEDERQQLYEWLMEGHFTALIERLESAIKRYRFVHHVDNSMTTVLCLVVDQFEKICANPEIDPQQRQHFLDALAALAKSGLVLTLVTSRNDFYQEIMRLPHITELKSGLGQFDLMPPTAGEISEMIRNPARAAGLKFEQDKDTLSRLDDQIRDDAITHPDILPLLQYTLNELYLKRDKDNLLCFAAYHQMGGLQGALSQKVEAVVAELPQQAQDRLGSLLGRLVVQRIDGTVSARAADWNKITDPGELQLAQALIDSRLLISEFSSNRHTVSVTHEALFVHWPRAQRWIEQNKELLRCYTNLSAAAARWQNEDCSTDYLLTRGKPLLEARLLSDSQQIQLDDTDKRFIDSSIRHAGRRTRLRRLAAATVVALGALAGIAGIIATDARQTAELRQAEAENLVGFMLGDLMDRLRPLGRLNLLDVVGDEAMRYLESQPDEDVGVESLLLRARALIQIGEIRITQADYGAARTALNEAAEILTRILAQNPTHGPTLLQAGNTQYWLGYLHYLENDLIHTRSHWEAYQSYAEQWAAQEPDNPDAIMELSYAWNNLGTLANDAGQLPEATEYFERSTQLKQQVLAVRPDDTALTIELADSYSWTARTAQKTGMLNKAREYFQQELDLMNSLYAAAGRNNQVLYRLVIAQQNTGQLASAVGNSSQAIAMYLSAIEQMRALIAIDVTNKEWQKVYAYLLIRLGAVYYGIGEMALAETQLELAHEHMQQLTASNTRNIEWRRSLINAQAKLAQARFWLGQRPPARQLHQDALQKIESLFETNNNDLLTRTLAADIMITEGEWMCQTDRAEAESLWRQSVEMLEGVAAGSMDTRILAPLLRAKVNLRLDATSLIRLFDEIGYRPAVLTNYINNNLEENQCLTN